MPLGHRRESPTSTMAFVGWCQDYPDPYNFINVLLDGGNIQAENNNNLAYFNNPTYNTQMDARREAARRRAADAPTAQLDIDITKNQAPLGVAGTTRRNRFFFSSRVDPRSFVVPAGLRGPAVSTSLALK